MCCHGLILIVPLFAFGLWATGIAFASLLGYLLLFICSLTIYNKRVERKSNRVPRVLISSWWRIFSIWFYSPNADVGSLPCKPLETD